MKLKLFNKVNSSSVRNSDKATINLHKSGLTTISGRAAEDLGLNHDDYIEVAQDEERPKDWYLIKSTEETGFKIRRSKEDKNLTFGSRVLFDRLVQSLDLSVDVRSINCMISTEAVELGEGITGYAIITKSAKVKEYE